MLVAGLGWSCSMGVEAGEECIDQGHTQGEQARREGENRK
jgi:hypothetical protein